mmetsp:Transcript_11386/g.23044  ORF Transcript_11386/g.23044 Transcript_11386/m.23044 type:complete len:108 (+) Transcript_11386:1550-1873(+)
MISHRASSIISPQKKTCLHRISHDAIRIWRRLGRLRWVETDSGEDGADGGEEATQACEDEEAPTMDPTPAITRGALPATVTDQVERGALIQWSLGQCDVDQVSIYSG